FSGRRRHTRFSRDWSSDVCSSDLECRFGFAQALREWPANERAKEGFIEATLLMAGYHIDNGEAASAESLLDELADVPEASIERRSEERRAGTSAAMRRATNKSNNT